MRHVSRLAVLLAVPLLATPGCAPNDLDGPPTVDIEGSAGERPISVIVPVRKGGKASAEEFAAASAPVLGGAPLPIFLNRQGGTYRGGSDDSATNRSSVVAEQGRSSSTLPAYRGSDSSWVQTRDCVKDEFARFNITVTDVEPASGPYIEAVFGGNGSEIGFSRNVGGVAPLDPQDCTLLDRAIVFIFTDNLGTNAEVNCEVAAQEIAHAISLDHELLASDPMTYLSYAGHKVFQDRAVSCGEYSARACVCRRPNQNSVQTIATKVGWAGGPPPPPPPGDGTAPVVAVQSPADGATLPANSTIKVVATATDNVSVARVDLLWRYNGAVFSCPGSSQCSQAGSTYTFTLNVGSGDRTFQLRASDGAGNTTLSAERTFHLGSGGPPPPPNAGPVIQVREPTAGDSVQPGETVHLRADVEDPDGVAKVQMTWSGPAGSLTLPLSALGGPSWGIDLQVSSVAPAGPRQIAIKATDSKGASTSAAPITISVIR